MAFISPPPARARIGLHHQEYQVWTADEHCLNVDATELLFRALNIRNVVGVVGSGTSCSLDYPDWRSLYEQTHAVATSEYGPGSMPPMADRVEVGTRGDWLVVAFEALDERITECNQRDPKVGRGRSGLHQIIASIVGEHRPNSAHALRNALPELIERLRIRRFITTNYDLEIEFALAATEHAHSAAQSHDERNDDIEKAARIKARHFRRAAPEQLTEFAVGAQGMLPSVFHLHGVWTVPESLIVTESDYQQLYLTEDTHTVYHQQGLDLLFSANSLLFIGSGLSEEDMLRPLRRFVNQHRGRTVDWPFFAIWGLERDTSASVRTQLRQKLFMKYGIKAIFYEYDAETTPPQGRVPQSQGEALQACILRISEEWRHWWLHWQLPPTLRVPEFKDFKEDGLPNLMIHHLDETARKEPEEIGPLLAACLERLRQPRVLLITGLAGSGKGTLGARIAFRFAKQNVALGTPAFYSTMHFTNEFLATLQAARAFLTSGSTVDNADADLDTIGALRRILVATPCVLVIGGVDRLLLPAGSDAAVRALSRALKEGDAATDFIWRNPAIPIGRPFNNEVHRLLEMLAEVGANPRALGRVVLTSSVLPDIYIGNRGVDALAIVSARLEPEQLPPQGVDQLLRSAISNHVYGTTIIGRAVATMHEHGESTERINHWRYRLVTYLTAIDHPRRLEEVVRACIRVHRNLNASMPSLEVTLDYLALIGTPVTAREVWIAHIGVESVGDWRERYRKLHEIRRTLKYLDDSRLVIRIVPLAGEDMRLRYTVHTLVRAYSLHKLGNLPETPAEPQRLALTDMTREETELYPGSPQSHLLVRGTADALIGYAEVVAETGRLPRRSFYACRAAFGIIRSRWSAHSVARLPVVGGDKDGPCHLVAYHSRLSKLLNAIRASERPADSGDLADRPKGILYADEYAWLYNELGTVAWIQGALPDAYAYFQAGQLVNRLADNSATGARTLQSEINLGLVHLERGRLKRAREHLATAIRMGSILRDREAILAARGFMGLIQHLTGEYENAKRSFLRAILGFRRGGHTRGESIFLRLKSNLSRNMGELDQAAAENEHAVAAAEAGRHPELVHYARVSGENLARHRPANDSSRAESDHTLDAAMAFATAVGIPKLEAEVRIVRSNLALDQRNTKLATTEAMQALGVATANDMRLRMAGALGLLGQIAAVEARTSTARSLLDTAVALARRQGYVLQIERSERVLRTIRFPPSQLNHFE